MLVSVRFISRMWLFCALLSVSAIASAAVTVLPVSYTHLTLPTIYSV